MEEKKIKCPICDEGLADVVEEIPEKCKLCDTWKPEILRLLEEQGHTTANQESSGVVTVPHTSSEDASSKPTEKQQSQLVIEEEVAMTQIQISTPNSMDDSIFNESSPVALHPIQEEIDETTNAEESSDQEEKEETIVIGEEAKEEPVFLREEAKEEPVFLREEAKEEPVFLREEAKEKTAIAETKDKEEGSIHIQKNKEKAINSENKKEEISSLSSLKKSKEISFQEKMEVEEKELVVDTKPSLQSKEPPSKFSKPKYTRSGASNTESFPEGFKYCPNCKEGYSIHSEETHCQYCSKHSKLEKKEQGFAPGHYLILYNDQNRSIAYFRMDHMGSIIIGRSSERNSPNDIDLTMAWKHHYQKYCPDPEEFKKKMAIIKGISRKHALIRYDASEKQYVLFHLSDKNFTVVTLPTGQKLLRPPQDRSKVELKSGAIIHMGNQKEYVVMKYKYIPPDF